MTRLSVANTLPLPPPVKKRKSVGGVPVGLGRGMLPGVGVNTNDPAGLLMRSSVYSSVTMSIVQPQLHQTPTGRFWKLGSGTLVCVPATDGPRTMSAFQVVGG